MIRGLGGSAEDMVGVCRQLAEKSTGVRLKPEDSDFSLLNVLNLLPDLLEFRLRLHHVLRDGGITGL